MAEFYRVVRVRPNGTEQHIRDIPIADVTEEQAVRAQAFTDARTRRDSGLHIRIYSSSNETISPGDVIWDSAVNQ